MFKGVRRSGSPRNGARPRRKRKVLFWIGIASVAAGFFIAAQIPFFYWRSHVKGDELLAQAKHLLSDPTNNQTVQADGNAASIQWGSTWTLPSVQANALLGGVRIPSIGMEAPLLQGTEDPELDVGAGHLISSAWPGGQGTCVIAAHNATWFRHLDQIHPGDTVQVWTKTGLVTFRARESRVVKSGDPIPNTHQPSLVLEACYPLNALYLTPYRYLVYADWVRSDGASPADLNAPASANGILYHAQVPEALIQEGITLNTNSLPMGSLEFTGQPTHSYTQSNSPLSASSTLVQLYLAWVHASSDKNSSYLKALLPNGRVSTALWGMALNKISYDERFNVTLHVDGETLQDLTAQTVLLADGRRFRVDVTASVDGDHVMHLQSVDMTPVN